MNKLQKIGAAFAATLVLGLGVSAPAWADDTVPPADTAPVAVETAPESAPAPPAPAPVVVETPAVEDTPAEEPVEAEAPTTTLRVQTNTQEHLAICHSGNGNNWTYIAPDAQGYNGHQHHDADIYGLTEEECLAKNVVVEEPTKETYNVVAWLAPAAPPHHFDSDQTFLFNEEVDTKNLATLDDEIAAYLATLKCGTDADIQVDGYIDDSTTDALIAGGVLHGPNNPTEHLWGGGEGVAWKFVHLEADACPPPVTEPQVCTQTGAPYTEDSAPTQEADGLRFGNKVVGEGFTAGPINWLFPASGNLQGITSQSINIVDASGYQTAIRIVVNPNTDLADGVSGNVLHYASVSAEPYMNGWSAGQTGVFTLTQSTNVWSSKIANGNPGSQSNPVPLSQMAQIMDANQLISIGAHLGSSHADGQFSTIASFAGCASADNVPTEPEPYSTYTEWVDEDLTCDDLDDLTVDQTRTRVDTTFTFENGAYVAHDSDPVVENGSRTLTDEEATALHKECDEVVPPTDTPEPPTETPNGGLAFTGSDPSGLLWAAAILLSAGGLLGGAVLVRRRQAASQR